MRGSEFDVLQYCITIVVTRVIYEIYVPSPVTMTTKEQDRIYLQAGAATDLSADLQGV